MYSIELINKKTKQIIKYDDVVDLNDGEKMFFKFQINTKQLDDGEYILNLYDDDTLIKTDTLSVGDFNAKALQYKRGEDIYCETKIDVELNNKFVELNEINTTVYPDDGIDGMLSVAIDATQVFQNGREEGYQNGREDGIEEQRNKLSSITITENDTYINENGYNEITVDVQPNLQEKYVNVTDNNTTVTADDEFDGLSQVNIDATPLYNNAYSEGKSDGVEEQKEKLTSISITDNGTYTNEDGYNEVTVDVKAQGGAFDFNVIGYDDEQTNETNQQINNDIAYSKSVLDDWNDGTITKFVNNYQMVYCPQIDTSKIISFANFFQNCYSLRKICKISTLSSGTDYSRMFLSCSSLTGIYNTDIDTSKGNNFESFCENCSSLKEIDIDMSNATNLKNAFTNCESLQNFNLNVINNTSLDSTFSGCTSLTQISNLDTTKTTTLRNLANGCTKLSQVNDLNTPLVTNYDYAFQDCKSLITAPKILNCVGTTFKYMFGGCTYLENVELFDLSNATNVSYMFSKCVKIKHLPNFNTNKVTNFMGFLNNATGLVSLPVIDMSSATNITSFFGSYTITNLTEIGGFKNLKINWTSSALDTCPNLTRESLLNVINNLYDFRGNGDNTTTRSIKIGSSNMYSLTDEDKAIATAKGWVLTS